MDWEAMRERYNEDRAEHMTTEPVYVCNECEEGKEPLVVRVKVIGEYKCFKCCPDCGEELESV